MRAVLATHAGTGDRDLIWMTVLGAAARRPVSIGEVCHLASGMGCGGDALIAACIDEMLRGGTLRLSMPQGRTRMADQIATTASGLEILAMLALAPWPPESTPLGRVARQVLRAYGDSLPPGLCSDMAVTTFVRSAVAPAFH